MSVNIFKLRNLISALSLLILESKTGNIKFIIPSLFYNKTFETVPTLSVIKRRAFKNSSAP